MVGMLIYTLEDPTVWKSRRFMLLFLTNTLVNPGNSANPGHGEVPGRRNLQNAVGDHSEGGWNSTVSATAKLLLRAMRDTADAFPPLKSVTGGLCAILENCEVVVHLLHTARTTMLRIFTANTRK